jgi:hypothetical protein
MIMKSKELKRNNKTEGTKEVFSRLFEVSKVLNEAEKQRADYQTKRPFKFFKFWMIADGVKYGKDNFTDNWKEIKNYER